MLASRFFVVDSTAVSTFKSFFAWIASASEAALYRTATFLNPSSDAFSENAWYFRFAWDSPAKASFALSVVGIRE